MYQWTDKNGSLMITDDSTKVPDGIRQKQPTLNKYVNNTQEEETPKSSSTKNDQKSKLDVARAVFEDKSSPVEGMPYFKVIKEKIDVHESASSNSPIIATIKVEKDSAISFDFGAKELIKRRKEYGEVFGIKNKAKINTDVVLGETIQKTIKPGIIRAAADGKAQGFSFKKGDVIEDLLHVGEGVCVYRYGGTVLEDEFCLYSLIEQNILVQESRPVTEWWLSVFKNGKKMGWLKIDDKSPLKLVETIK
jgi:hypothetical protein